MTPSPVQPDGARDIHRVLAVVVTYNRRELLGGCLDALDRQSRPLDRVLVVDNASTDGTADHVQATRGDVGLIRLSRNTGGAGGFATGIAEALADGADLIWLMDDDTEPTPTALQQLIDAWRDHPGEQRPAFVAGGVVWTDGRKHPMNTPRQRPGASASTIADAATVGCIPVRSASFVSLLLDADAVREEALPVADYFLWNDDFEYSSRLARHRVGLLCPASVAVHRTARFGSTDIDPGERFYFEVRNKIWVMAHSHALTPAERALFGGATLRRWARTAARSSDRAALWNGFRRGVADGVRKRPRRTADLLAEAAYTVGRER